MTTVLYDPAKHISNLINKDAYKNLTQLRSDVAFEFDDYFRALKAPKVDLYMIANSVSSPMGKGSDSVPFPIKFGHKDTYLVDSAQFGMEPLVQKSFDMVYCYLPSFRGEEPDGRHLNQFYHCEAELRGDFNDALVIAENLVKSICTSIENSNGNGLIKEGRMTAVLKCLNDDFIRVNYEDALILLQNDSQYIEKTEYGRIINSAGEAEILNIVGDNKKFIWLTHFDRDTVAFYQKPDSNNTNKVLNADLLAPKIDSSGFSGEILGLGQRQDNSVEIRESMDRQSINDAKNYDWYCDLRDDPEYVTSSGFGLGVERLIAWIIGFENISDACLYPVIKNIDAGY